MTIDKHKFATGMGLLAGAFNRTLDAPVSRMYYGILSAKMDTAEFERAVSITLESETFWPSPAVLLGKVKADDDSRAALAFEHVNRVTSSHGGYRFLTAETYQREFDAPTKAAISACGGLAAIGNTSEDRWAALHRKFVAAYADSLTPKLPTQPTDARVKQLTASTAKVLDWKERASGRDA